MKKKTTVKTMKNFKIKGKVVNGKYRDLKIIDKETGKEIPYAKKVIISLAVEEMPTVSIEYYVDELELDIEASEDETIKKQGVEYGD